MKKYSKERLAIIFLSLTVIALAGLLVYFLPKKKAVKKPRPVAAIKGRIAIVLDDWGYNLNNIGLLNEIDYPLNISILPNLPYSKRIVRLLRPENRELILHLPLEPESERKVRLEKDTIMTRMRPAEIRKILINNLNNLPGLKGVSNHMGSKATQSSATMRVILEELDKRGLYFLDSLVGPNSVCAALSSQLGGKFIKRDVFIDNKSDPDYIKGQLEELKLKAVRRGYAVGIGHDRKNTLLVLKEVMPQLSKEGFKFVFVSELTE